MKVAVIGSRTLWIDDFSPFLPANTTEIISGGAKGIDSSARLYALRHQIPLPEYLPDYQKYGRRAPLIRNIDIIRRADLVLAFWDGRSTGTVHVIRKCRETGVPYRVFMQKTSPSPAR